MRKYKYAVIGMSRISIQHVEAAKMNDVELVAVCDLDISRADDILDASTLTDEEKSKVSRYDDFNKMLDKEQVDFVAITTDSGSHGKIALECIEKGKHIIIEKPIALSLKDADLIIKRSEEKGIKLAVSHQNRFNPAVLKLKNSIENGEFGKLFHGCAHIRWNRNEDYFKQASWRGTWKADGGSLLNQCIHNIDILRWVLGSDVDEVFAYTDRLNHPYIETDDLGLGLLKMKNGAYGFVEGTINVYPKNLEETLFVFGEKGTAKLCGPSVSKVSEWKVLDQDEEKTVNEFSKPRERINGLKHSPVYKNFIGALDGVEDIFVDGKAARDAIETVFAIYKSSKEGKPVKLPLKDVSVSDFEGMYD
jgi:UDP-N-acetyl-2-amino-2-deoxyglucuronate dehydrogenase